MSVDYKLPEDKVRAYDFIRCELAWIKASVKLGELNKAADEIDGLLGFIEASYPKNEG